MLRTVELPAYEARNRIGSSRFEKQAKEVARQAKGHMTPQNIDRRLSKARALVLGMAAITTLYVAWGLIRVLS